ncbi:MAG: hypothetical protein Aurels2KO_11410 [Aureliella sp.]
MPSPRSRVPLARRFRTLLRTSIAAALLCHAAPYTVADDPLQNIQLSGSVDVGDTGRKISTVKLGDLTVNSSTVGATAAFPVQVKKDGYLFLSNGLLLRNESGSDFTFTGDSQSFDFAVYNLNSGAFNLNQQKLPATNLYQDGADETVVSAGGNWNWQAEYKQLDGTTKSFSLSDPEFVGPETGSRGAISPLTLQREFDSPVVDARFNRVESSRPVVPTQIERTGELQWSRSETSPLTLSRENALFEVSQIDGQALPTLDLSSVEISGSGTLVEDRRLYATTVDLGRQMVGAGTQNISRSDDITIRTTGSDDTRTRLQVGAFTDSAGGISTTLSQAATFNAADSTAVVQASANFNIDLAQTGTFRKSIDVGANISSLENLNGETVQSSLDVGYQYAVVDNNQVVSEDITAFVFDNQDTGSVSVFNPTVAMEFSTTTHTNLGINANTTLGNDAVRSVTLNEGNGITAEGLAGENVIAETTYNVHRKSVQSSQLTYSPEGVVLEGTPVSITNERAANASLIQATSMLVDDNTIGSSRWSLPELNNFDGLSAGETLTMTPTFDATGLDDTGTLGRSYWTTVDLTFEDQVANLSSFNEAGSQTGLVGGERIYGTSATRSTVSWTFDKKQDIVASTGSASLAVGSTLRGSGLSLTNTSGNSTDSSNPLSARVLDSGNLDSATDVTLSFSLRGSASAAQQSAAGFDRIASDVVDISGLDGTLHVVELSGVAGLGNGAEISWLDPDKSVWAPAVLGNSNVEDYDLAAQWVQQDGQQFGLQDWLNERRFEGGYFQYLATLTDDSLPELGAFGADENGIAWSVIDHNSSFAVSAVPEPSSCLLVGLGLSFGLTRRRRNNRPVHRMDRQ